MKQRQRVKSECSPQKARVFKKGSFFGKRGYEKTALSNQIDLRLKPNWFGPQTRLV
jgi:hypothetical protein